MTASSGFLAGQIADLRKQLRQIIIDVSSKANSGANTDITSVYLSNTGLKIQDTDATHGLSIVPGSQLTADRVLTLITGDNARTLTLSGNPTLDNWFDQSVKTTASPTFGGATITDSGFFLIDDLDATKKAQFEIGSISTATTKVFTLPDVSAPLVALKGISQRFELYTAPGGNPTEINTMYLGRGSGNTSASGQNVVAIGPLSGSSLTSGSRLYLLGTNCGQVLTSGSDVVAIGYFCAASATTASESVCVGNNIASVNYYTGSGLVSLGHYSARFATSCSSTVLAGRKAGYLLTSGSNNVCIGDGSGEKLTTQSGNVFIGRGSGGSLTVANTLVIANSNTTAPLILGDFSNNRLAIGGLSAATARLHLAAGTTAANSGPLKLTSGSLVATPEAGLQEYNNAFYQTKSSSLRYGLGGAVVDFTSDQNNTGTGETDLYSYTTPASTLAETGEKLIATYCGTFNDASATAQIKAYFAGTAILDTGAITLSATGAWTVDILIIRTGASTARAMARLTTPTASKEVYSTQTDLTGLTFTNANIIKITGTAGGVDGGNNDITAKLGTINWMAAA